MSRAIRIRRMDDSVAIVNVADEQHYMAVISGCASPNGLSDYYEREVLAIAPTASKAKLVAAQALDRGERVISARKIDHQTVAVCVLHKMEVYR